MRKPPKTHYLGVEHDSKIPLNDINRLMGYKATICGYQRKNVRLDPTAVNCKLCLKEMEKRNI